MFSLNCVLQEILPPKPTRNKYYVNPVILAFMQDGKPQTRYMQCVTTQAKEDLKTIKAGDKVVVRVALKGTIKGEKCFNLDEIISIETA